MQIHRRISLLIVLLFSALSASASATQTFTPTSCRYAGGDVEPGAVVCLEVSGKRSFARCEMVLNNSSWSFLGTPCSVVDESESQDAD
jgi:hypothetical protein